MILLTGHRGFIGQEIQRLLLASNHEIRGFDAVDGDEIRDATQVRRAMNGCRFVVHLAALLGHNDESDDEIFDVNIGGTEVVLNAAKEEGVERVVFFSSAAALGVFGGRRAPDYLPLDDDHPCYPTSAYAISKQRGEDLCRDFTGRSGIGTICLRPPGVFDDETYKFIRANRRADADFEWTPYWEFGAFLDVRDAASAAVCALRCPDAGHARLLVCADDISSADLESRELARRIHPNVPWRGGKEFERQPFRALIDTRRAREILGWEPQFRWRD